MGCDIHVIVEKKFEIDGKPKWVGMFELQGISFYERNEDRSFNRSYHSMPGRSRNYDLFAKLAGVRGDGPEPKGLPPDASELTTALYGDKDGCSDYHSHSYCTMAEYIEHLLASEYDPASVFLGSGQPQVENPYVYYFGMDAPEEGEEFRCVFCFDN